MYVDHQCFTFTFPRLTITLHLQTILGSLSSAVLYLYILSAQSTPQLIMSSDTPALHIHIWHGRYWRNQWLLFRNICH